MRKTISTYLFTLLPLLSIAQPGTVDTTFHSGLELNGGYLNTVLALPDGDIMIGGRFTQYDGVPCGHIARLHPDGAIDTSFGGASGFNNSVNTIVRLPDGGLLVGGGFTTYEGQPVAKAIKLRTDGSLDTTFTQLLNDVSTVVQLVVLPDGRILVAAYGSPMPLRRLMPDGTLDATFQPPAFNARALSALSDGKIMVGTNHQSASFLCLHRLNENGNIDTTFRRDPFAAVGLSWAAVNVILPHDDGSIWFGGHFNGHAGAQRNSLARVSASGIPDSGFNPPSTQWRPEGLWWSEVNTLLACDEGRVLVPKFGYIRRLNLDGTLDTTFHSANASGVLSFSETNVFVVGSARQTDGKILLVGSFSMVDGIQSVGIVRLQDCVVGSACDDGDPQTTNDTINGQCVCAGTPPPCTEDLVLALTLDAFGSQTTWTLQDDQMQVVASGGPYADGVAGSTVLEELCVPQGCYHLMVHDAAGNGITAGGYVLTDGLGRRVVDATGAFSETSEVLGANGTVPQAFCLPLGDARMLPGLCDKPGRSIALPVYASSYTGATQYQFWIFDPHGTYSRKVALTAPQFVPGNLATLPVPTGVDLNICVRPLVNGAYRPFGGVCKYRFTPHAVGSTATSLLDAPSITLFPNPNHTRTVNLAISGVDTEGQLIQVELFDAIGQRAFGGSFPATAETFQQTLPLNSELPAGLYLLNITIDGRRSTHRLVLE